MKGGVPSCPGGRGQTTGLSKLSVGAGTSEEDCHLSRTQVTVSATIWPPLPEMLGSGE
jgi:hypothetical protein